MAGDTPKGNGTPRGALTVRTIAMPADTNANGDIFGGWVMAYMDQAGGIAGVERAQGRVVTIKVDAMTFIKAMRVGDVLEVYTEVESVGRTSMKSTSRPGRSVSRPITATRSPTPPSPSCMSATTAVRARSRPRRLEWVLSPREA